jgi:hypothetical protein
VEVVVLIRRVCFYVSSQKLSVFRVTKGKNASQSYAMLPKACGGEAMKKSSVSKWHKWCIEDSENVEDDDEVVAQDLTERIKMLKMCGMWCIQTDVKVSEL